MADIRCPMCGESASDELEICPVCQARLKPLIISLPGDDNSIHPGEEPVGKDTSELEMADLSNSTSQEEESIRPGETPAKKNTSELESALPAWLRKLRGQTGQTEPAPEPEPVEQAEPAPEPEMVEPTEQTEQVEQDNALDETWDIPETPDLTASLETREVKLPDDPVEEEVLDWLSGLEQTAQEDDETPAWLSNIKDMPQKEQSPPEPLDENAPRVDGNWLDGLRGDSPDQELDSEQEQEETPIAEPVFDEGIPDWMKKLQAEVDAQTSGSRTDEENPVEDGNEDSPDWLNRLQAETQSTAASNESAASGQDDETPDWLDKMSVEIQPASDEIAPIESETPEWLRNLQAETQSFEDDSQPVEIESQAIFEESQPSDTESPDWLKGLHFGPSDSTVEDKSGSELPDWLTENTVDTPGSVEENPLPSSEVPEWLQDMQVGSQSSTEDSEFSETISEAETPEWLKEIAAETPERLAQESSLPGAEAPDWLIEMGSELQDPTEAYNAADETGELEATRSNLTLSGSDKLDELMPGDIEPSLLADPIVESEFDQQDAGEQFKLEGDELQPDSELMPDWLNNIDKTDTNISGTPALLMDDQFSEIEPEPSTSAEMPGWLKTLDTDGEAPLPDEKELETEPDADEILPAELPSWVQAMRPVESMVADMGVSDKLLEQITETAGPLAGLHGVLPTSPGLGKLRKPLNYSIKLRVSDDQSLQADQLEQMLGVETQAKSTTSMHKKLPQRILRWVVAALVFLVVAFPIVSGKQNTSAPTIYPPELMATREILFRLPPASPVLLVFDYEPAYSGELEVTAAPMVDNLLFSGARLAILSTSPTGPALAEHFLKTTQSQHNYQSGLQYANLGYLAGGASGVLSFVLNPSQTIPQAMDGSLPWQSPLLQDIHTLADFKAVIIFTDNSDTARIWVEQAGTTLGETPLLMAISAQAEPMIRPYYDSKQIKGLVTGLAGGKAYEQALEFSGLGQKYWDSFSYGLFIAELIIIFGALWSIVSIWRNRKSVLEEEA